MNEREALEYLNKFEQKRARAAMPWYTKISPVYVLAVPIIIAGIFACCQLDNQWKGREFVTHCGEHYRIWSPGEGEKARGWLIQEKTESYHEHDGYGEGGTSWNQFAILDTEKEALDMCERLDN